MIAIEEAALPPSFPTDLSIVSTADALSATAGCTVAEEKFSELSRCSQPVLSLLRNFFFSGGASFT
jgi:hypothetical protein